MNDDKPSSTKRSQLEEDNTLASWQELAAFLPDRHPQMAKEVKHMIDSGSWRQLPMLRLLLCEDMQRFKRGEESRYVRFQP